MEEKNRHLLLEHCAVQITLAALLALYQEAGGAAQNQAAFFARLFGSARDPEAAGLRAAIGVRSRLSDFFTAADGAADRFVNLRDILLDQRDAFGEEALFSTCPLRRQTEENWAALLAALPPDGRETLRDGVEALCAALPPGKDGAALTDRVSDGVGAMTQQGNLPGALASLTLIAGTLFCWNALPESACRARGKVRRLRESQDREKNARLYSRVLPEAGADACEEDLLAATRALDRGLAAGDGKARKKIRGALDRALAAPAGGETVRSRAFFQYARFWQQRYEATGDPACESSRRDCLSRAARLGHLGAARALNELTAAQYFSGEDGKAWALWRQYEQSGAAAALERCCGLCREALAFRPQVADRYRGEAAYLLYRCAAAGAPLPPGETGEQYLILAHDCGCPRAQADWDALRQRRRDREETRLFPSRRRADDGRPGAFVLLCDVPALASLIRDTAPDSWQELSAQEDGDWADTLSRALRRPFCRVLLFFEDELRNLHALLRLLQTVRDRFPDLDAARMEILIRGGEDALRPLIDTALSHMEGRMLPVRILDDARWPGRFLLARHPLFFPIRALPEHAAAELAFVVFGSGAVAEHLVREAFALLGFRDRAIRSRIIVVTDDPARWRARLYAHCPALRGGALLKAVNVPALEWVDGAAQTSLEDLLQSLCGGQDVYCYFAVARGGAQENLALAMGLREAWIRRAVQEARDWSAPLPGLDNPPPIAFYCPDDAVAHLSRRLVTDREDYGDQWFNNWGLIPFGERAARYRWDALEGTLEQMTEVIHLQYTFGGDMPEEGARRQALGTLYARQYNRQSSAAMALSLPYRLFQFQCGERRGRETERLTPLHWRITDAEVFSSADALCALAAAWETRAVQTDEEFSAVAAWEHERWVRWCAAQGWVGMSAMQSAACICAHNPRHQLYIARMHPCMCPGDALDSLSRDLAAHCGGEYDFTALDRQAVALTGRTLRLGRRDQ